MITVYGIKNCDTVKKALKWFDAKGIEYTFFDYKKQHPSEAQLKQWIDTFGWDVVVNKRGTTYRKLDETTKNRLNADTAAAVLLENNSMIKRPIVETESTPLIGFKADEYEQHFTH